MKIIRISVYIFILFFLCNCFDLTRPASGKVFDPSYFRLKNGLQVVVISDHRMPVVTQMVWYKVGSADEPEGLSGLAHFLEHLMFKGTKNFAPGAASKIISKIGGNENAFTGRDFTAFYQTVAPNHLSVVMNIEADRMVNLELEEDDVVSERSVVIEERLTRTDSKDSALWREQTNASMYLTYPYRNPIIGWADQIPKLSKENALEFYHKWYVPNNAVLIIAGDITFGKVKRLVNQYYAPLKRRALPKRLRVQEIPHLAERRLTMRSAQIRQARWNRQYLAPNYSYGKTDSTYALQVLTEVLGGGTTSRLYQSLVVDSKVATAAGSWYNANQLGPSVFGFYGTPSLGNNVEIIEDAIDQEIRRVLREPIADAEISAAIKRLSRSAILARDSITAPARIIGEALLTGRNVEQIEAWPLHIAAVSAEQIMLAAKEIFVSKKSVTSILLPKTSD